MYSVSKGDFIGEPIGYVLGLLIKAVARSPLAKSVDQWGWPEWLWLSGALITIGLLVWVVWHYFRLRNKSRA